jgi:hypothetical protein
MGRSFYLFIQQHLTFTPFPPSAWQAHILLGLAHHSLIYVGQMRDSGCKVTFTADLVTVKQNNATIISGG